MTSNMLAAEPEQALDEEVSPLGALKELYSVAGLLGVQPTLGLLCGKLQAQR